MRKVAATSAIVLIMLLIGCGGNSASNANNQVFAPNIAGQWEINAGSSQYASTFLLAEADLAQSNSSATASGNSAYLVSSSLVLLGVNSSSMQIGGFCFGTGVSNLSVTLGSGSSVSFVINEGGNIFNGSGTLSADNNSISGTYSSPAGSSCPDVGTFVASRTQPLTGTYSGSTNIYNAGTMTATLSEDSNYNLTITGTANSGSYQLTGTVVGNAFIISGGNVGGNTLSNLLGYKLTNTQTNKPEIGLLDPLSGSTQFLGTLFGN